MKKISLLIFILLPIFSFGQSESIKIKNDILQFDPNQTRVKTTLDSVFVEKHLATLINSDDLKFKAKTKYSNGLYDSIILSQNEKHFLIENIRKQYHRKWSPTDFRNFKTIEQNEIKPFIGENFRNGILMMSDPIIFRQNKLAIVYLSYSIRGSGHSELVFYKKLNEVWEKSIPISAEYY